jgi:hypothetical protein
MTTVQIQSTDAIAAQLQAALETENFDAALEQLFAQLQEARETMSEPQWQSFCEELRAHASLMKLVQQDPMTARAYRKPRGYAGDAVMMDYLYGIHSSGEARAQATGTGRKIFEYVQSREAARAVRGRRGHLAGLIDDMAAARQAGARVLAMAAGHLREAELSHALRNGALARFLALDADTHSLAEVRMRYAALGVETIQASVRHLLARKLNLGEFDFVYAAGLYDYLADNVAIALTARLFEMTAPGGLLLIPNFAPGVSDRAYMESFMDWHLIYRDEYDMSLLAKRVDPAAIESYDIYSDETGSVVYLAIRKRRSPRPESTVSGL